ncbi:MAG: hypothetical protein EZS28_027638 [Streblomastix strix]|uniref:Protein kinase domain-containing protein n=1 Tax=Streblomastix strix TaxID=222440 RepID=A0A5J4V1I9_9EUKA|nr:MAG: hypothetical protein EZS28_027638 [Streblomastix strix]
MPTVRAMMKQILEGIRVIHEKGLIHRDIKGQNILMHSPPGSGRVILKIADFGITKIQQNELQLNRMSTKGTPPNMAPELALGYEKADQKVDMWSAGVVLYQLVSKEYPIKAKSIYELLKKMKERRIERPEIVKNDILWDLISNLLSFDPNNRLSAEQALQHPFFTNEQAQIQITDEIRQLTYKAEQLQIQGYPPEEEQMQRMKSSHSLTILKVANLEQGKDEEENVDNV